MSDAHSPAASEALEASNDERSPQPDSDDDQGIDLRPGAASPGDSSEEDATDSEEERAVRKGQPLRPSSPPPPRLLVLITRSPARSTPQTSS